MFLMLLISATIYFLLGTPRDGIIMLIFVVGIISIDIIQEWKTDKTIKALQKIQTDQKCRPLCCSGPTGPTARCNKSSIYFFKW